jgi:SAM-dependent methyltransferase
MAPTQDAFGKALLDRWHGDAAANDVVERDDGFIDVEDTRRYFDPIKKWPTIDRQAFRRLRGRVLDVGCGAGRVALELQTRGHEVTAIDVSPGAVGVCTERGVRRVQLRSISQIDATIGSFDRIALFGNNLGLVANPAQAARLLRRFTKVLAPNGAVVAVNLDPYGTTEPVHLAYQERNRQRGRAAGQIRLRIRYQGFATPWFDYLFLSVEEVGTIAKAAGWRVADVLRDDGPVYAVELRPGL